jgi:pyruvate,water dikinase
MALLDIFSRKKTCDLLVNVDGKAIKRYRHFKDFLTHNHEALNLIAELEQTYYTGSSFSTGQVRRTCDKLMQATRSLIEAVNGISRGQYEKLSTVCDGIAEAVSRFFSRAPSAPFGDLVLPFEALRRDMVGSAGGKATNLATVGNTLGLPIPRGFVITAHAFERFLDETGLARPIEEILAEITPDMTEEMQGKCKTMQEMILKAEVPAALAGESLKAYEALEAKTRKSVRIAMRSSAVGEDTEATFAGQYRTELNVSGENLLEAYKAVIASKYSPRAILYRLRYGLDERDTPMCVAGIAMVDSRASGVLYTVDPTAPESGLVRIGAIWGLGEHLVSGAASPDLFWVDKKTQEIKRREISRKGERLVSLEHGGTHLEEVPEDEKEQPSIDDDTVRVLTRYGSMLEEHFKGPQDVEWAVDRSGKLFILQSRPLGVGEARGDKKAASPDSANHAVILSTGRMASAGLASGIVVIADGKNLSTIPEGAILVARTASPDYAKYMERVKGLITDVGSVASHLASVAREFGVPAIVDTKVASSLLRDGQGITIVADSATVYDGIVPELAPSTKSAKRPIFESPMHRRMRAVLDLISPLNLSDPKEPGFAPDGCRTIQDIIRFSHEQAMREMFLLSEGPGGGVTSVKLTSNIPLMLYCIDLGGGLKEMLTTCDTITPDHIESIPMKALWGGFTHPGISWRGAVNLNVRNLMTLMASGAAAEAAGGTLGGDSYAILSRDYLNLSAKFGYHYANVDVFCSGEAVQNHILLQFAGGAGFYVGRSLRISLLANVLGRLGFTITVTGDVLDASLKGCDMTLMEYTLDQLGRLMAASRLLDVAIPSQAQVDRMTEAFFNEEYDFLNQGLSNQLPGFYTHTGEWQRVGEEGRLLCLQDGSKWGTGLSSGVAILMGKMIGAKYQEFLDTIGAYYYFPIAIAKESLVTHAVLRVRVKPVAGTIDRAGGLAFGIRNVGNYFVLRVNALEDNFTLFEFVNNRRFQRANVHKTIESGRWYTITVEISGNSLKGYLDGERLIEYTAERPLKGHVGMWTKADSVTYFDELVIKAAGKIKRISF